MNNSIFKPFLKSTRWVFALILILFSSGAYAQGQANYNSLLIAVIVVGVIAIIVLFVSFYTLQILNILMRTEAERKAREAGEEPEEVLTFWQRFLKVANKRVEMEKEESIVLDHNYDGIRELDNHLPPWWKYLFYLTIVFAFFYFIFHHVTDTLPLQEEEYEIEIAEAAAMAEIRLANQPEDAFKEADLVQTDDPAILASGQKIFVQQCAVCHKEDGGGNIGPNLTDNYWIHGGDIKNVYTTIKVGVPDKGMISWEAMLSPTQMRDVSNYVLSLKGTNPPGAKAPQGELVEE